MQALASGGKAYSHTESRSHGDFLGSSRRRPGMPAGGEIFEPMPSMRIDVIALWYDSAPSKSQSVSKSGVPFTPIDYDFDYDLDFDFEDGPPGSAERRLGKGRRRQCRSGPRRAQGTRR